jgi:hypothetical protein
LSTIALNWQGATPSPTSYVSAENYEHRKREKLKCILQKIHLKRKGEY